MAPQAHTGSSHLSQGLLLLWVLLGTGLCHMDTEKMDAGQESGTSSLTARSNGTVEVMENYTTIAEQCWNSFVFRMTNVSISELCEWKVISRPYSKLQKCLESWADNLKYGYPNALAEQYILQSHFYYFYNCTLEHPVYFDPPEDVLLAMIIAPICLIPFLVTLVIWRSKDSKAQ
ncbi:RAMP2 protein, partial [Pitta sordida]|nr:RAMP2 protein [Pitta sordida]